MSTVLSTCINVFRSTFFSIFSTCTLLFFLFFWRGTLFTAVLVTLLLGCFSFSSSSSSSSSSSVDDDDADDGSGGDDDDDDDGSSDGGGGDDDDDVITLVY